jgi:hypothetical protein
MNSAFQFQSDPFYLIEEEAGAKFDSLQERLARSRGRTVSIHPPLRFRAGAKAETYPNGARSGRSDETAVLPSPPIA